MSIEIIVSDLADLPDVLRASAVMGVSSAGATYKLSLSSLGGAEKSWVPITSDHTALPDERLDIEAGGITITLPEAPLHNTRVHLNDVINWSANPVTLQAAASPPGQTIDGNAPPFTLDADFRSVVPITLRYHAGEANWYVQRADNLAGEPLVQTQITPTISGEYSFPSAIPPWPIANLALEGFNSQGGWGAFTIAHDPASNWGPTQTGRIVAVRIRSNSAGTSPDVRLYSDNAGTTIVGSSTTSAPMSIGSAITQYQLDTPLTVADGTQMLAAVLAATVYVDTRTGYTERYGAGTGNPTNSQVDRFTAITYLYQ